MKALIVYDSLFGNTKKIAQAIQNGFNSSYTSKVVMSKDVSIEDLKEIDLLIVGSPTHGGRPSENIKNFLGTIPAGLLDGVRAAAFDTGIPSNNQKAFLKLIIKIFGYASPRIAKLLKSHNARVLDSQTFFVLGKEGPLKKGELERAKTWGENLIKIRVL